MQTVQAKHGEAAPAKAQAFLSVNNIEVVYCHVILVLKGVSLEVPKGGIVALLGANGAGKTTTLRAISGMVRRQGRILFDGKPIDRMATEDIARLGVRSPESAAIAPTISTCAFGTTVARPTPRSGIAVWKHCRSRAKSPPATSARARSRRLARCPSRCAMKARNGRAKTPR